MKKNKPFTEMSADQLAEATKQYEAVIIDMTRPLNAKERRLWEQAKRGRGRPKIGKGARKVSISLEETLLEKADAMAKKTGENRSELIARLVMTGLERKAV